SPCKTTAHPSPSPNPSRLCRATWAQGPGLGRLGRTASRMDGAKRHSSPIPTKFRHNLLCRNTLMVHRSKQGRRLGKTPSKKGWPWVVSGKPQENWPLPHVQQPVQVCSLLCTLVGMSEKCRQNQLLWQHRRELGRQLPVGLP